MILLVGDGKRADVVHAIAQVEPLVREHARDVVVELDCSHNFAKKAPKLVLNFGGDGSILHIARRLGAHQVPILGVNFGKFGFLAEFELPDLLVRIKEALDLKLPMRRSLMLQVDVHRGGKTVRHLAVNDVVLQRSPDGRMSTIHVSRDGAELAAYTGDGLVVSTPLGSTAHNLSAGGPILHPEMDAMVLTPICAHTLSIRPLALPAGGVLKFWLDGDDSVNVTLDGQDTVKLAGDDYVEVRRADQPITLVAHPTRSYFDALRAKFGWTSRAVVSRR